MKDDLENAGPRAASLAGAPGLPRFAALTGAGPAATAAVLAATLGLAAACWVVSAWQMNGMNMGTATPARLVRRVHRRVGSDDGGDDAAGRRPGRAQARPQRRGARRALGVGSYLAVWAVAGVVVYAVDRPHGSLVAGVVTIAAGVYEFTPLKQHCRRRCRDAAGSGLGFGLLLRRVERRTDGGAGGPGSHERHLDGGDRGHRPGPEAPAAHFRLWCAGGSGDHRARGLDRGEPHIRVPGLAPLM